MGFLSLSSSSTSSFSCFANLYSCSLFVADNQLIIFAASSLRYSTILSVGPSYTSSSCSSSRCLLSTYLSYVVLGMVLFPARSLIGTGTWLL